MLPRLAAVEQAAKVLAYSGSLAIALILAFGARRSLAAAARCYLAAIRRAAARLRPHRAAHARRRALPWRRRPVRSAPPAPADAPTMPIRKVTLP